MHGERSMTAFGHNFVQRPNGLILIQVEQNSWAGHDSAPLPCLPHRRWVLYECDRRVDVGVGQSRKLFPDLLVRIAVAYEIVDCRDGNSGPGDNRIAAHNEP